MLKLLLAVGAWLGVSAVSLACMSIVAWMDVPRPVRQIAKKVIVRKLRQEAALSPREAQLVNAINAYRTQRGRAPLRVSPALQQAARDRAPYARPGRGHWVNGRQCWHDARRYGYSGACGENLAWGSSTPDGAVFNQWAHSSGHNRNQLNRGWNTVGAGVSGRTYVAIFGK